MVGSGRQHLAVKWLGFGQTAGLVVVQGKLELLLEGRGETLGLLASPLLLRQATLATVHR
jgi:hypothetical protein